MKKNKNKPLSAFRLLVALDREWHRIRRRPFYAVMPVVAMAFCTVFFLTLMKEGLPENLPVAVVDMDGSSLSRTYIRNMDAMQLTDVTARCATYGEALDLMQRGEVYAFVVIPDGFQAGAMGGRAPEITYYINDSFLIAGSLLLKDITYISVLTSGAMQQQVMLGKGMDEAQIMGVIQPVAIDNHMIANPWANYGVYLVNLLLPGVLQLLALMLAIYVVGIEFKERTAKEWLASAGRSLPAALIGKLLPYTILFSALGVCCNAVLYLWMGFPMNGSFAAMCLATILYIIATQCVGVFIFGLLPDLRYGISLGAFYGLLGFTYAGFTFPIDGMPRGARIFSELFPMRHYFRIYVAEALNGAGARTVLWFAVLGIFVLLPATVGKRLKKAIYLN